MVFGGMDTFLSEWSSECCKQATKSFGSGENMGKRLLFVGKVEKNR